MTEKEKCNKKFKICFSSHSNWNPKHRSQWPNLWRVPKGKLPYLKLQQWKWISAGHRLVPYTKWSEKKVEKLLVEECKVFLKDENDIDCIESLKLKFNFEEDTPVSQRYFKIAEQLYNELKQYLALRKKGIFSSCTI